MTDRRWRCVVCEEFNGTRTALPPLNSRELDGLHASRVQRIQFIDEEQLKNAVIGTAFQYLTDLAEQLRARASKT